MRADKICKRSHSPSSLPSDVIIKVDFIFRFARVEGVKEGARLMDGSSFSRCLRRSFADSHAVDAPTIVAGARV